MKFSSPGILLLMSVMTTFGIGKQLGGAYTPASEPALAPEVAAKKFVLPEGLGAVICGRARRRESGGDDVGCSRTPLDPRTL